MRILIAPQEFKGTLTAAEAAEAMGEGSRRAIPDAEIDLSPMSDGGPGMVDAVLAAAGGRTMRTDVHDPLGRPVEAEWGLLDGGAAVIEMAAAAGLTLLAAEERDPRVATSYGVGELVGAALDAGRRSITVGLGGSATNDGGAGMATALGARFLDSEGRELPPGGPALARLDRIDVSGLDERLREARIVAAADVTNPLCGPDGASLIYGPQKGASPEVARELDAALRRFGEALERDLGVRVMDVPGAGAAGGLGAGMLAILRAEIRPGFDVLAELTGLRDRMQAADLALTGEGRLDAQTSYGKTVERVARLAGECGAPVLVVAGAIGPGWERILPLVVGVEVIVGSIATEEAALARPREMVAAVTQRALHGWRRMEQIRGSEW